jgi:integrase
VIQEAMGHASITTTIDRYGHLLPGTHVVTAAKLDGLLDRADSAVCVAQLD